jgi:hypothetical protein
MAISKDQLTVEVVLDSSGAIKGIKDLEGQFVSFDKVVSQSSKTTDKANQSTGKVGDAFSGLSSTLSKAALPLLAVQTAVTAVTQVFGVLSGALSSFVNDYAAAEKAQTLLTQAIENSGGRIQNTADAWGAYLDQLQEAKAVDADVLRGLVAQAVQMGFSEKQIKSLVEASIGLSKVTGDSLDGSFQKLIGTTRGMARGLSAMIPELQNLTEEQLRSGDAFDIVAGKYKSAAGGAGSYAYSVKQAGLAAGELSEDVGKLIVESINLKGAMDAATSVINGVRGAIAAVDMEALSKSFKEFISVAGPIALVIGAVVAGFTGLTAAAHAAVIPVVLLIGKFALIAVGIAGVIAAIEILVRNTDLLGNAFAIVANSIGVLFLKPLENAAYALREFFSLFGDNAMSKAADQVFKGIEKSVNSLKDNVSKNFSTIKNNIDTGLSGQIIKQASNLMNGFSGETKKADASLKALGETGARVKVIDDKAVEKATAALKDIQKQTDALKLTAALTGQDEIAQIRIKADEQMRVIDLKRKELSEQGILNGKHKEALEAQKQAVIENRNASFQMEYQKKILESQKEPVAKLKSMVEETTKQYQQSQTANLGTFQIIDQQAAVELDKIAALERQLELTGALTEENQAALDNARAAVIEMQSEKTGTAIMSGINSAISAAQGGADALVGNMINQIGKAFGPEGEMIAGVVNLLRKGKDFTKQLGQDLIAIIADLPRMLTEGAVGLIEGLVDGLTKLLGDPKAVQAFIESLVKMMPTVMAALVKAVPQLAIALARPSFWIAVVKAWVKATIDGFGDVFRSLGDAMGQIGRELGNAIKKAFEDAIQVFAKIGTFVLDGFKIAFNWLGDQIANIGTMLWNGFMSGLNGIGDFFASIGTRLWDGIKDALNGIGSFFKNLFKFDGGGKGGVENFLGFDFPWIAFAEGGHVPGKAQVFGDSAKNDTVPALLSPGEFVIPRSKLQDKDNLKLLDAIMNGGTQKKSQGEWIERAQKYQVQQYGFGDWVNENIVKPVVSGGKAVAGVVQSGFQKVGDLLIPDWLKDLFDSLSKFISGLDIGKFVTDPLAAIESAIKGSLGFLVDPFKRMMSFNTGGYVPGVGFSDTVPAMLTPGEFVINRNAANALGGGLLNQLNAGRFPMQESAPVFNINLNVETKDALDANFIRSTLIPTIKSELKASSLRGDFVLSAKGVRS